MDTNPFLSNIYDGKPYYHTDAQSRITAVRQFDLAQCRQALTVEGLQKTVAAAVRRRIKQLEVQQQPVSPVMKKDPYLECCRCRHKHHDSQRVNAMVRGKPSACPRCGAYSYRRAEDQPDLFAGAKEVARV